jgi:ubiquinone/menaquinone biosynthesis C-methylase UbiE
MNEMERIQQEYASREKRFAGSDVYSMFNASHLFAVQQRQRATLKILRKMGINDLVDLKLLEIGCGSGKILQEFLNFGMPSRNLYGLDLLINRLSQAQDQLPVSQWVNGDGQVVPFRSGSFDLVTQYTALSSILDPVIRERVAAEMLRILKPGGFIIWYDFWLNPANSQTHGLRRPEIRSMFPNCRLEFEKITLAPPLARRLVPVSWGLAFFLESLRIFNSHYLVIISPKNESNL